MSDSKNGPSLLFGFNRGFSAKINKQCFSAKINKQSLAICIILGYNR
jgi:hypothetical protein